MLHQNHSPTQTGGESRRILARRGDGRLAGASSASLRPPPLYASLSLSLSLSVCLSVCLYLYLSGAQRGPLQRSRRPRGREPLLHRRGEETSTAAPRRVPANLSINRLPIDLSMKEHKASIIASGSTFHQNQSPVSVARPPGLARQPIHQPRSQRLRATAGVAGLGTGHHSPAGGFRDSASAAALHARARAGRGGGLNVETIGAGGWATAAGPARAGDAGLSHAGRELLLPVSDTDGGGDSERLPRLPPEPADCGPAVRALRQRRPSPALEDSIRVAVGGHRIEPRPRPAARSALPALLPPPPPAQPARPPRPGGARPTPPRVPAPQSVRVAGHPRAAAAAAATAAGQGIRILHPGPPVPRRLRRRSRRRRRRRGAGTRRAAGGGVGAEEEGEGGGGVAAVVGGHLLNVPPDRLAVAAAARSRPGGSRLSESNLFTPRTHTTPLPPPPPPPPPPPIAPPRHSCTETHEAHETHVHGHTPPVRVCPSRPPRPSRLACRRLDAIPALFPAAPSRRPAGVAAGAAVSAAGACGGSDAARGFPGRRALPLRARPLRRQHGRCAAQCAALSRHRGSVGPALTRFV